jgi:hypothetical protein
MFDFKIKNKIKCAPCIYVVCETDYLLVLLGNQNLKKKTWKKNDILAFVKQYNVRLDVLLS